jgi:hypothetical protein
MSRIRVVERPVIFNYVFSVVAPRLYVVAEHKGLTRKFASQPIPGKPCIVDTGVGRILNNLAVFNDCVVFVHNIK